MPEFPEREADILNLARRMVTGLRKRAGLLPHPPCTWMYLGLRLLTMEACLTWVDSAQAQAQAASRAKDQALAELIDAMRLDLRYAENVTDFDDARLKLIGWSTRRPKTAPSVPGPPGLLRIIHQGPHGIRLAWEAPSSITGGKVRAYRVQRRTPDGPWTQAATSVTTQVQLRDQPRGVRLEFRVLAVNRSGSGEPGNTVAVVL